MLDREDLEVLSIALENAAPPSKRSIGSPSADNNAIGPFSPANISVNPEFACLLQEAGT